MDSKSLAASMNNGDITFFQFCKEIKNNPEIIQILDKQLLETTDDIAILKILKLYIQYKDLLIKQSLYNISQSKYDSNYLIKELKPKKCFLFKYINKDKNPIIDDSEIFGAEKFIDLYFENKGQKIVGSKTFDHKWIYIKIDKPYLLDQLEIQDEHMNSYISYDPKNLYKLLTI